MLPSSSTPALISFVPVEREHREPLRSWLGPAESFFGVSGGWPGWRACFTSSHHFPPTVHLHWGADGGQRGSGLHLSHHISVHFLSCTQYTGENPSGCSPAIRIFLLWDLTLPDPEVPAGVVTAPVSPTPGSTYSTFSS